MAGESLVPNLPLFRDEAERALRIFKRLQLPDVIGTPRMSEASGEWFFDIVEALFGAYDAKHNKRMIQEFFLLVPKKNGKSSYAAAIMVVAIIVNRRPNAEFLLIAPTKEIADISFKQASGIIKLDAELSKLFLIQRHIRTITHRESGSTIQIKAADTDVITGSKSTGILVDETHVFAKKANAAELFVEVRGALTARPDGFMIQISTQSKEPPSGVFRSELNVARDVRDGKLKLPRLAVIYELPEKVTERGGWKDPKTWPLVNPNIGRSVSAEFLGNELITAEREGAAQLALLASQHFNVEIGQGFAATAGPAPTSGATAPTTTLLSLDALLERCDVVTAGLTAAVWTTFSGSAPSAGRKRPVAGSHGSTPGPTRSSWNGARRSRRSFSTSSGTAISPSWRTTPAMTSAASPTSSRRSLRRACCRQLRASA
jgi:phage terminase large subunit-like protein